jgi:hypothetical protein
MNQGEDYTDGFRNAQDALLQKLVQQWGVKDLGENTLPQPSTLSPRNPSDRQRHQALNQFMQRDFLSH